MIDVRFTTDTRCTKKKKRQCGDTHISLVFEIQVLRVRYITQVIRMYPIALCYMDIVTAMPVTCYPIRDFTGRDAAPPLSPALLVAFMQLLFMLNVPYLASLVCVS